MLHYSLKTIVVSLLSVLGALCTAPVQAIESFTKPIQLKQHRVYGAEHPFKFEELPLGTLRNKLEKLSPKARSRANQWLHRIQFHDHDIPYMRVDAQGGIFFVDAIPNNLAELAQAEAKLNPAAALPALTEDQLAQAFKLHSKPDSSKVIYLDFNGHTVTDTVWNDETNVAYIAKPYDTNSDPEIFNDTERSNIIEIWRRVAEDYAPFDVDVTTEEPPEFTLTTGRVVITQSKDLNGKTMPYSTGGGVGYIGVWGAYDYDYYSPVFVYYNNLISKTDYIAEAAAHEMGHNLGLSHDGDNSSAYYKGHGTGNISWAPIMGTAYGKKLTQWSKGEYTNANQTQDDLAIITQNLTTRADDHGNAFARATALVIDEVGNVTATRPLSDPDNSQPHNKGIIHSRNDIDIFSFTTTGGLVSLQVSPLLELQNTPGGNLDVKLELYNEAQQLIASSAPAEVTEAGISQELEAGNYYLTIKGDSSINYTNYASIGQYFIDGVIPIKITQTPPTDTQAPSPNPVQWFVEPYGYSNTAIAMTAATATDDQTATADIDYYFTCVAGTNCQDSGWIKQTSYTASGLVPDTDYIFRVRARDANGNTTSDSRTIQTRTLPSNKKPQPANDQYTLLINTNADINVLDNDTDPDLDPLELMLLTPAKLGQATILNNQLHYQAGATSGKDKILYLVRDPNQGYSLGQIEIDIQNNE